MDSAASRTASTEPKKRAGYNPLRPNANPLRPQNQQNSRNTSSISIGSEINSTNTSSNNAPNTKPLNNTPSTTNVTNNTNNEVKKEPVVNESSTVNDKEVEKLNSDLDEHLRLSRNNLAKSTSSLSSNPLAPRSRNPLAPQKSTQSITSSPAPTRAPAASAQSQSTQNSAPAPAPASTPAAAPASVQSKPEASTPASAPAPAPAPTPAPVPAPVSAPKSNNDTNAGGDMKNAVCAICHEKIGGSMISANKKFYHQRHFLCSKCSKSLCNEIFHVIDDNLFCNDCYNDQCGVKCAFCNEFIDGEYTIAMGKNWHPEHFCCFECHEPLGNGIIEEKDGKVYCHKDYQKLFGICCTKCNQPILSGGYITALDKPWHVECFVCNTCGEAFTSTFHEVNGLPYCDKHYQDAASKNAN